MTNTESTLDRQSAHRLLSHTTRRHLLSVLLETGSGTVEELAEVIARRESERSIDDDLRHRIETTLVHSHIPRMVDCGLAEYDSTDRRVSLVENARQRFPFDLSLQQRQPPAAE